MEDVNILIQKMIECAKAIRRQLGPGYLESVYKNAMLIEMQKHHVAYQTEVPLNVLYDGIIVGKYRADIIVDNRLILELKATTYLTVANEIQLVNYLTATGIDDGLLINFGADQLQFKRKYRVYRQSKL
ncbi:MAG: GxxExxY protein [Prevotella sp.]|jgi:GxxExxY protein|nr:GxxExxY protein [Prevotella sp.]